MVATLDCFLEPFSPSQPNRDWVGASSPCNQFSSEADRQLRFAFRHAAKGEASCRALARKPLNTTQLRPIYWKELVLLFPTTDPVCEANDPVTVVPLV